MGHSIQVVGNKVESFNDLDLVALLCLLAAETESAPNQYRAVAPLVANWNAELAGYGPGCIRLGLEERIEAPEARAELVRALAAVERRLRTLGAEVPANELNERCQASGVTFFDFPVPDLVAAISMLRRLVGP